LQSNKKFGVRVTLADNTKIQQDSYSLLITVK